jgi:hypothetical protein
LTDKAGRVYIDLGRPVIAYKQVTQLAVNFSNQRPFIPPTYRGIHSFIHLFTFHNIFTRLKQPTDIEIVQ